MMWGRKKGELAPQQESPPAPVSESVVSANGENVMFSHPGAYGVVMLPPTAVKAGFFARRRRRARAITRAAVAEAAANKAPSNSQSSISAKESSRVDELVSEAKASAEAERSLRVEAARLLAKKTQLEKEIRKLQRDKEEMTDAHRTQLERLRRDLEAGAMEGKRRLQEELEKGHARSMDSLRLTLKSETEHLTNETKRLRDELQKSRQARSSAAASATAATEASNKIKSRAPARGAGSAGAAGGSKASTSSSFGAIPNGGVDSEGVGVMPGSVGFWKSLTDTFTPSDLLGVNVMSGGGGGGGGVESVPPPALMVLAAVPLFCLYKRWQHRRLVEDNSSDDGQLTDKEESEENWEEFDESAQGEEGTGTGALHGAAAAGASAGRSRVSVSGKGSHMKRRSLSSSPSNLRGARPHLFVDENSATSSLKLFPQQSPRNPEALVSPSVLASRTPSLGRRHSTLVGGRGSFSSNRQGAARPAGSPLLQPQNTDSPASLSSGRGSSDSPSPERSTPSVQGKDGHKQKMYNKRQPLLLARGQRQQRQHPQQQHLQQQQQQRLQQQQQGSVLGRPAPRGLAAAAATAAARAAERQSSSSSSPVTAGSLPPPTSGQLPNDAVAAANRFLEEDCAADGDNAGAAGALAADRAAGARAMRGALEGLRGERDSLANACGRLEAQREASSVQLKEGVQRARELERAKGTLEQEKIVLEEQCGRLEEEVEACGKGECTSVREAEGRARALERRVSGLEEGRNEASRLIASKETELAALKTKIDSLQQALAAVNATAAAEDTDGEPAETDAVADEAKDKEVAGELAERDEEVAELMDCMRSTEEEKQALGAELAAAVAENERASVVVADMRRRVAEKEVEVAELMAEIKAARESAAAELAAAEASSAESREAALCEARAKLAVLEEAKARVSAELVEAKTQLDRLQEENIAQQGLFEAKVSELAEAATKICLLEESVTRHLGRQGELEDTLAALREETQRLECKHDELKAEASAKLSERTAELEALRARADDLSSKLESTDADREEAEVESKRLQRDLEGRCRELELEKQAQAAEYERQLAEGVEELKANALAKEAAARERDQLEARNAERLQALEMEKASLRSDLRDKYASASEELKALSTEKMEAEAACSRLREGALALEQRAEAVAIELKTLAKKNASLSEDADSSRALLRARGQELAELAAKAAAEAATSSDALSRSEALRAEERRLAKVSWAEIARKMAEASAAARGAKENQIRETGGLRQAASKLARELKTLVRAKDAGEREAAAALEEKAERLSEAMDQITALEASAEEGKKAVAALEAQVSEGESKLKQLADELQAERSVALQASQAAAVEAVAARQAAVSAKEDELYAVEVAVATLEQDLISVQEAKDAADGNLAMATARVAEIESELRLSAEAFLKTREDLGAEVAKVACLTREMGELEGRMESEARAAAAALRSESEATSVVKEQLRVAKAQLSATHANLSAAIERATAAEDSVSAVAARADAVETASVHAAGEASAALCLARKAATEQTEEAAAAAAVAERATVERELEAARRATEAAAARAEERQRRVEGLEEEMQQAQESYIALEASTRDAAAALEAEKRDLTRDLASAQEQTRAAEARAVNFHSRLAAAEEDARARAIELMSAAEAAGADAAAALASKAAEMVSVATELREARSAEAEAGALAEVLEGVVEEVRSELVEVREELEVEKRERGEEVERLRAEVEGARAEALRVRGVVEVLEGEAVDLRRAGGGVEEELARVRQALSEVVEREEAEKADIRNELERKEKELACLASESRDESAAAQAELQRLRREVEERRARDLEATALRKEQTEALEAQLREVKGVQVERESELERVTSMRDTAEVKVTKLEADLQQALGEVAATVKLTGDREVELECAVRDRDRLAESERVLHDKIKELTEQSVKAAQEIAAMTIASDKATATTDKQGLEVNTLGGQGGLGGGAGEPSPENTTSCVHPGTLESSQPDAASGKESSGGLAQKVTELQEKLNKKNFKLAKAEEQCLIHEAKEEEFAIMVKALREQKERYMAEVLRKRDKAKEEWKVVVAASKAANALCREKERENTGIKDDFESRLRQQAANYEEQMEDLRHEFAQGNHESIESAAEDEVDRLKAVIGELEESRKVTARRLRDIMKKCSQNEERFLVAVETEKKRADRFECMLEDSRKERDAECERLQQNIDSQKEQLDVKVATVKHLWEKVAAIRRAKAVGSEDLKSHLDDAVAARESLSRLAEDQQEQIDRLRRRAKRKEEEITKTVMARLKTQNNTACIIDEDECGMGNRGRTESRDSFDSAQGTTKGSSAALRSQLADIKAERLDLMCKCQSQEQQVADLRKLVNEIAKLEQGAPDVLGMSGDTNWETLSVCSDVSGMSQEGSVMPRGIDDISEGDLRELAKWFRTAGGERRRLLKRYKTGRQKTEALAARKQAGGDMFASARGSKLPTKGGMARSPNSDAESVKSARSARSAQSASTSASNISARLTRAGKTTGSGTAGGRGGGGAGNSPSPGGVGRQAPKSRVNQGRTGGVGASGSSTRSPPPGSNKSPRAKTRAMGGRAGWV